VHFAIAWKPGLSDLTIDHDALARDWRSDDLPAHQ
jgi:hypothetical protein